MVKFDPDNFRLDIEGVSYVMHKGALYIDDVDWPEDDLAPDPVYILARAYAATTHKEE